MRPSAPGGIPAGRARSIGPGKTWTGNGNAARHRTQQGFCSLQVTIFMPVW